MASLSELTDYDPQSVIPEADGIRRVYINGSSSLPVDNTVFNGVPEAEVVQPSKTSSLVNSVLNKLFRDDDQRYQLWPEKVIREGLTGAGDVASGKTPQYEVDPATGDVHTSPQMIEKAQAISALAGTGGLGGVTDATLGATPFLRPALKYKDRLYKGKEGQQHMDVIPDALYPEFQKMAMSGEDISHYNFGFVNEKGHFLDRKKVLAHAIDNGLVPPDAGKYGALTSTLMADSSKPGTAIEAMAKSYATDVYHGTSNNALTELKSSRASRKEQLALSGIHVAENPEFASIYAGEGGNVMPLKAELGKMLDATKLVVQGSPEAAVLEDLLKGTGRKPMYMESADGGAKVSPPLHSYIDSVNPSKAEKILDKHGYDSVKYQAKYGSLTADGKGMNVSSESPSYLIRNPANLRSKFAKFNPDDFGKNGLLLADSSKPGTAIEAMAKAGNKNIDIEALKDKFKFTPVNHTPEFK